MPYKSLIAFSVWIAAGCGGKGGEAPVEGPVTMEVTEAGYVPASFKVRKGKPVELLITRKTDATCAKEIVIDEHQVNTPLPLGQQVRVSFTPEKSGQLKFGCGMDKMISGMITVE